MSNPDQLAADTRRTQDALRTNVSQLTEQVNPDRFVGTRREKLGQGLSAVKDRVMGVATTAASTAADAAHDAADTATQSARSAAGSVQDAAHNADASARDGAGSGAVAERTQGNPVAAGLIAFGAGWLLSSLLPASTAEQAAAEQLGEHADGLIDPVKKSVAEAADTLAEPARDAARSVQQTAAEAANRTTEHARSAAGEVSDHAQDAAGEVSGHAQDATGDNRRSSGGGGGGGGAGARGRHDGG